MNLQQMSLFEEREYGALPASLADSLANHTALSGKDWLKMTNGTYGRNLCDWSGNCSRGMLLAKMLMASYQQYMSPFAPTWKEKVTKSGRSVYRLVLSERIMKDTEFVFLASPRASQDFKPIRKETPTEEQNKHGKALCASLGVIFPERIGQYINPQFAEWMMGFPLGWGGYRGYKERMTCYGNAVVPQQFFPIFQAIAELERGYVGV